MIKLSKLTVDLLAYAQIAQAPRDVLDELLESVIDDLDEQDIEVEFETNDMSERIEFLIHVLGPDQADEAVRAAIDGELAIEMMEAED